MFTCCRTIHQVSYTYMTCCFLKRTRCQPRFPGEDEQQAQARSRGQHDDIACHATRVHQIRNGHVRKILITYCNAICHAQWRDSRECRRDNTCRMRPAKRLLAPHRDRKRDHMTNDNHTTTSNNITTHWLKTMKTTSLTTARQRRRGNCLFDTGRRHSINGIANQMPRSHRMP